MPEDRIDTLLAECLDRPSERQIGRLEVICAECRSPRAPAAPSRAELRLTMPNNPALLGRTLYWQRADDFQRKVGAMLSALKPEILVE